VRGHSAVGGIPDNRSESSEMGGTAHPRTPFDAVCIVILFTIFGLMVYWVAGY
jgi:hypothetical protein